MSEVEMDVSETQLDIDDLNNLLKVATRPKVKQLLNQEIAKLSSSSLPSCSTASSTSTTSPELPQQAEPITKVVSIPRKYYIDISNYAWDQSDKFMKIYVTVQGVHKLPKESISTDYTSRSFILKVENLDGKNYKCHVGHLFESITPSECFFKVKTDTVLLMLKKEKTHKTWAYVVQKEDKMKTPKFDDKKDPNESLMDLMKKLYDEGDDEMKRTIAKSFAESRNKVSTGDMDL
ncbi:hypothetical protein HELRODRAFT_185345 [Helobdella robusta]|uniref:Calcyclin-binding protein n=1 Tax=Helobdella robusta TaxID=6412 RepID=T1FMP7_HELRO|nr:hypothetical protein HELRODRAFT_185345 [Helobdella robusta]ESO09454.1 hypothetical protein HELRODRAFT_185345 [Helobdella robusta]